MDLLLLVLIANLAMCVETNEVHERTALTPLAARMDAPCDELFIVYNLIGIKKLSVAVYVGYCVPRS